MIDPIEPDKLYTVNEVAGHLRSSNTNVYDLLEGGRLEKVVVGASGKGLRVRGSALTAFLAAATSGGPTPPKPKFELKHIKAR